MRGKGGRGGGKIPRCHTHCWCCSSVSDAGGQRTVEEKPEASRGHIFSFFFLIYSNHRFGTVDLTLVPQKLWPLKFIRPFAIHWFLSISLWPWFVGLRMCLDAVAGVGALGSMCFACSILSFCAPFYYYFPSLNPLYQQFEQTKSLLWKGLCCSFHSQTNQTEGIRHAGFSRL